MEEKTISYLNTKWYYRFVKVLFISFSLMLILIVVLAIFFNSKPQQEFDGQKSYIVCNNGTKFIPHDKGVDLYIDYVGSYDTDTLNSWCGYKSSNPLLDGIYQDFKFFPAYKTNGSWFLTIAYSLIALLGTLFIVQVIRRLFYYIVLGKIFPKK